MPIRRSHGAPPSSQSDRSAPRVISNAQRQ